MLIVMSQKPYNYQAIIFSVILGVMPLKGIMIY